MTENLFFFSGHWTRKWLSYPATISNRQSEKKLQQVNQLHAYENHWLLYHFFRSPFPSGQSEICTGPERKWLDKNLKNSKLRSTIGKSAPREDQGKTYFDLFLNWSQSFDSEDAGRN